MPVKGLKAGLASQWQRANMTKSDSGLPRALPLGQVLDPTRALQLVSVSLQQPAPCHENDPHRAPASWVLAPLRPAAHPCWHCVHLARMAPGELAPRAELPQQPSPARTRPPITPNTQTLQLQARLNGRDPQAATTAHHLGEFLSSRHALHTQAPLQAAAAAQRRFCQALPLQPPPLVLNVPWAPLGSQVKSCGARCFWLLASPLPAVPRSGTAVTKSTTHRTPIRPAAPPTGTAAGQQCHHAAGAAPGPAVPGGRALRNLSDVCVCQRGHRVQVHADGGELGGGGAGRGDSQAEALCPGVWSGARWCVGGQGVSAWC